jgi:hypothetical protein
MASPARYDHERPARGRRTCSALMVHSLRIRPSWRHTAIAALAVIGIGITALLGLVWQVMDGFASCSNVVLSSTRSPDRARAVLVFRQECNATVPDSVWATIAPTDRPLSPDRNHAFLGFVGGADVQPRWRGNDAVEIVLSAGAERFIRREETVDNVRVDYK